VWEMLISKILPDMIGKLPVGYVLRAWVTACSTGEEAYSLAIAFKEALEKDKNPKNISLQIFATDIDRDAIDKARKGVYSANIVADVSAERLTLFFKPEGENFRVIAPIREMVVFAPQNVIKDPPFTKLDILTCRNMLIYMEAELQKKLMLLFNYSLNPEGIMVLGTAETYNNQSEGFNEIDSKLKIFQRTAAPRISELSNFPSSFNQPRIELPEVNTEPKAVENVQILTDQFLLQRFAPASVLVNDKGDIIYMTGRIGKYLEPVAGKANWNIYVMAREGLRNELPGVLRRAMQNFDEITLRNITIGTNGGTLVTDVTVQRIESQNSLKNMIILIFNDSTAKLTNEIRKTGKRTPTGRMKEMEMQLQRSYEDLQGTREEMQTSQEELKSTNEELQSTNEELQSTNEELTTSKEEMQSLNEELQTVNVELQSRVSDFIQANDDMKNLLNSTEIATLFLDKELNIRRFTDEATKIFKLRKTDIGRPFTDLASDLRYPEIDSHAKQVLDTLISVETAITTHDDRWFNVRIMPYRTLDDRIDGLVITFTDITIAKKLEIEVKKANDILAISETRYRNLFGMAKDGIIILDAETGKILDVNPFLIELLGYSKEQFIEKSIWQIGFLKDIVANKDKFLELQQKEIVRYENLPLETADRKKINVEFVSNVYLVANVKVIQCFIREVI
jgi:two-component system CheB/CheR fusion protein